MISTFLSTKKPISILLATLFFSSSFAQKKSTKTPISQAKHIATVVHNANEIISNPTEKVTLPTYKEGEVGLAKPAIADLKILKENLPGFWLYEKTELENKEKFIKTEVRNHTPRKFKGPEEPSTGSPNAAKGLNPTQPTSPPMPPMPGETPSSPTSKTDEDRVSLLQTVEMLDSKFTYMFQTDGDTTGQYKVWEIKDRNFTDHTTGDIHYHIIVRNGAPYLSFKNTFSNEPAVNFLVFKCTKTELVLADLKRRVVHYYRKTELKGHQ